MADLPNVARFDAATVVLPVMNETTTLRKTVEIVLRDVPDRIRELLIVVCDRTTPEALEVVGELAAQLGDLVVVHRQQLPFLGGALREAFDLARASHVVMMASDMETDPADVRLLIVEAQKSPAGIVTASRWLPGGGFRGYSRPKLAANWLFQRLFSLLYMTRLTDMTYGFRIFPTKLVQVIRWQELRHAFLLETIVKPLRLGVPVAEIPSAWRARVEGASHGALLGHLAYFRTGLKVRFASRKSLLRADRLPERPG